MDRLKTKKIDIIIGLLTEADPLTQEIVTDLILEGFNNWEELGDCADEREHPYEKDDVSRVDDIINLRFEKERKNLFEDLDHLETAYFHICDNFEATNPRLTEEDFNQETYEIFFKKFGVSYESQLEIH